MFGTAAPWWTFVIRPLVVYLALLLGLRLFGRRELGQMTPSDLVVILLIANSLQNAMVGPDTSVTGGLLAAMTLLVANRVLARLRNRLPWLQRISEGDPVLLISGGRVLTEHLRHEKIELKELEQAAREHGISELTEVDTAVLEVDGTVSIIPVSNVKVRTQRDLRGARDRP